MLELNNFYISESVEFIKNNIPDNFIDLTVTSPPYDDLRNYNGFIFDYQSMLKELYRITKDGGMIVWVIGDKTEKGSETLTSFKHALYAKEVGFNVHDTMIYAKENPVPQVDKTRYTQQFEYMFVFGKGKPKTINRLEQDCINAGKIIKRTNTNEQSCDRDRVNITKSTKPLNNIWYYKIGTNCTTKDSVANKHPAQFPEQLANDHIISWSNVNDIVFDPMCGSGTTCKMAWLNKRNFIGVDISAEYINNIAIPRLKQYGWINK
jgi:site-specific DNA-methyltransferase (adenine-specific)